MIPLQNERLEQLERAIRKKLSSFSDLRSSDLDLWQSIAIYFGFEYLINKEPYPQTPDQTERQYILFFLSVIQPIVERIQNEPNEAILQGEGLNDNAVLLNEMEPIMQIQARDPEEEEQIYNTLMLRYNQVIQFLVGFSKSEFENEFSFSKGHRCVNILIVIIGLILFFTYAFSLSGIEINPEITDPYDIQRYIIDSDVADSFIKNYETVIPGLGDMMITVSLSMFDVFIILSENKPNLISICLKILWLIKDFLLVIWHFGNFDYETFKLHLFNDWINFHYYLFLFMGGLSLQLVSARLFFNFKKISYDIERFKKSKISYNYLECIVLFFVNPFFKYFCYYFVMTFLLFEILGILLSMAWIEGSFFTGGIAVTFYLGALERHCRAIFSIWIDLHTVKKYIIFFFFLFGFKTRKIIHSLF